MAYSRAADMGPPVLSAHSSMRDPTICRTAMAPQSGIPTKRRDGEDGSPADGLPSHTPAWWVTLPWGSRGSKGRRGVPFVAARRNLGGVSGGGVSGKAIRATDSPRVHAEGGGSLHTPGFGVLDSSPHNSEPGFGGSVDLWGFLFAGVGRGPCPSGRMPDRTRSSRIRSDCLCLAGDPASSIC